MRFLRFILLRRPLIFVARPSSFENYSTPPEAAGFSANSQLRRRPSSGFASADRFGRTVRYSAASLARRRNTDFDTALQGEAG